MGKEGYLAKINKKYYKGDCINKLKKNFKDSTGAGDNFDAGFIYGYIDNLNIEKSLKIANICGAKSVEYLGGVGDKEKFFELEELIRKVD